jgi:hypothetical protein
MKRVTKLVTACAAAALLTLTIGVAGAQDFNPLEKTILTFSGPVELPGVRLDAGTYVFRLADTPARNVVQVLSEDEMDVLGQWTFVQASRPDVSAETVVTFRETDPGATPAVQYWYYPNEKIGKEFIYPKDQAMSIAARTGQTVQSTEGEVTAAMAGAQAEPSTDVEPSAQASASTSASTTTPDTTADSTASAGVVAGAGLPDDLRNDDVAGAQDSILSENAQADASADDSRPVGTSGADIQADAAGDSADIRQDATMARADTLPATASPLALSGLFGLLSLVGAAGVRFFTR